MQSITEIVRLSITPVPPLQATVTVPVVWVILIFLDNIHTQVGVGIYYSKCQTTHQYILVQISQKLRKLWLLAFCICDKTDMLLICSWIIAHVDLMRDSYSTFPNSNSHSTFHIWLLVQYNGQVPRLSVSLWVNQLSQSNSTIMTAILIHLWSFIMTQVLYNVKPQSVCLDPCLPTVNWYEFRTIKHSMIGGKIAHLRNCFLDFAVEHWFGCRTTEPGFARDISTIEVWLIDMGVHSRGLRVKSLNSNYWWCFRSSVRK